jgi:hypothetical protein
VVVPFRKPLRAYFFDVGMVIHLGNGADIAEDGATTRCRRLPARKSLVWQTYFGFPIQVWVLLRNGKQL